MTDSVLNVLLGLLTSAIGAGAGWLAQTLRRGRRLERVRAFFGMPGGSECLLVVNRQTSSSSAKSVSRNDVFALMELAALVRDCGARSELVAHDAVRQGLGAKAEFCIGGPESNERTASHLAWRLPGVAFTHVEGRSYGAAIHVGDERYLFEERPVGGHAFALLARLDNGPGGRPTFLIAGQSATANHATVRHLTSQHRELARRYGEHGTFVLILRVVDPAAYGPDVVQEVADVTGPASLAREPDAAAGHAPRSAPATTPSSAPSSAPATGQVA